MRASRLIIIIMMLLISGSIFGYGNKINFYDEAFESFESGKEMVKYYKKTINLNLFLYIIFSLNL